MTKTKQQQQQQQNVKKNTFGAIHSILSKVGIKKKQKANTQLFHTDVNSNI